MVEEVMSDMVRFRSTETVRAKQWLRNGDAPGDGPPSREGKVVRYFRHPGIDGDNTCPMCSRRFHEHGWIDPADNYFKDGHQGRTVCPGTWVVLDDGTSLFRLVSERAFAKQYSRAQ
jgi:hypothetical protein